MNYYTLPKIHNKSIINPNISNEIIKPHISQTLLNYYNKLIEEIDEIQNKHDYNYDDVIRNIIPYQYIFHKVPGTNYSVSKIKTKNMLFYDLFEIFQTINLLETFKYDTISSLIVGENYQDSLECLELLRDNYNVDKFFCFFEYNSKMYNCIEKMKFNLIIYELNNYENVNQYVIILIELFIVIITQLKENSVVVIKINNLYYKPILEMMYLMNSLFEKTMIIKPNTSDITSFDKYIILQKFKMNHNEFDLFYNYKTVLNDLIKNYNINESNIHNIIDNNIPYYFLNKLDDINIIFGQQQLETINQIINILKSKNIEEKMEVFKKNNIQKSINWCEKFKIPCNKFSDKINIFYNNAS
jgi:hypothetical protein